MGGDRNGAAVLCWTKAYRIGDYLSNVNRFRDLRPPESAGVYIVSERPWDEMPGKSSGSRLRRSGEIPAQPNWSTVLRLTGIYRRRIQRRGSV